jgi:hypothetical protein
MACTGLSLTQVKLFKPGVCHSAGQNDIAHSFVVDVDLTAIMTLSFGSSASYHVRLCATACTTRCIKQQLKQITLDWQSPPRRTHAQVHSSSVLIQQYNNTTTLWMLNSTWQSCSVPNLPD